MEDLILRPETKLLQNIEVVFSIGRANSLTVHQIESIIYGNFINGSLHGVLITDPNPKLVPLFMQVLEGYANRINELEAQLAIQSTPSETTEELI